LEAFGFRTILEATNGEHALEIMQEEQIDLALVDFSMPVLDGIQFTRAVRAGTHGDPSLPIVMVSSHTEVSRVIAAVGAGVHEFVAKPFTARKLYLRILSALTRKRPFTNVPGYVGPCRRKAGERQSTDRLGDLETAA